MVDESEPGPYLAGGFEGDVLVKGVDGSNRTFWVDASTFSGDGGGINVDGPRGSILFRGESDWEVLAPSEAGLFLQTMGPTADPRWSAFRQVLTAPLNLYVRMDGNDANTGLANNPGEAFKTIQYAVNYVGSKIDMAGQGCNIYVENGTYIENVYLPLVTGGTALLASRSDDPTMCIIQGADVDGYTIAPLGDNWWIHGFTIRLGPGSVASVGINSYLLGTSGLTILGRLIFDSGLADPGKSLAIGNFSTGFMFNLGDQIDFIGSSWGGFITGGYGSTIIVLGHMTVFGNPTIVTGVESINNSTVIFEFGIAGTAVGKQYTVTFNATLESAPIPGDIPGTVEFGGEVDLDHDPVALQQRFSGMVKQLLKRKESLYA